ncbi:TonB-dependent receptor [Aquimarina sediminis]|uniref:TonB-dependent receptor n=1 Tax=Aquimarina sediminis TaxID=2070536 RepID=UPI001F4EF860|nr:TonB-dependent receptor [Aquimarina sediminis]
MKFKFETTTIIFLLIITFTSQVSCAQMGAVHGTIKVDGSVQELATVNVSTSTPLGGVTNTKGCFRIEDIPFGTYVVTASYMGYENQSKTVTIDGQNENIELTFDLNENLNTLNEIVVTGTKTYKRQTDSPVIVNLINNQTLDDVQACNLSEGLKFQPGLRVETDCQTCNYTQLRMNGLAGGYSQILINGRPIFSPLTGLYGLEQLPANMIDRIEVVRGGGSSLYGSSAIGGTVNVITKIPKKNSYELNSFYQNINGKSDDVVFSGNASLVSEEVNSGVSFFFNHRERELYDHNSDNFSEIPELENTSFGTNVFFLPSDNQKLEINISNLNEFRYGGEMVETVAHLTQQSEERTHNVWMGSADYQINFNNDDSSFITYAAWQNTKRKHYTGIFPDDPDEVQAHIENPPYGTSNTTTLQGGFQLNHKLYNFIKGTNTLTLGGEYVVDDVLDEISSYNYLIDQTTKDLGVFLQSDWEILPSLTLLSGVRMDVHNLVDELVLSPRASLLYKYKTNTQFRISYGTGFRAPQAFDTDLHIAFAGGGVSRVSLSPELLPEKSQSYSASINYDKPMEHFIAGFTFEGFRTRLNDAFFLQPIGEDNFGELFEKQNGQGATIQGVTLELRANYDKKIQLETGFTLQTSKFDEKVQYIDGLEGLREFIRTPRDYGFATLSITPNKKFNASINYVYTGEMKVPHFAGAPNQLVDEIITSKPFSEVSAKVGYTFDFFKFGSKIGIYGGVKNIFNEYQENFDIGKNRDSNFVFGPSLPRTIYFGIKLISK